MSTQTQTKTASLNANLAELPILKHFNQDEIVKNVESFRKGEKGIFWFLKLAAIGAVGYLTWTYVLPPIMIALGQLAAVAATAIGTVFFILAAPAIFKWLRILARNIHKSAIKYDPFGQLAEEREKMVRNQNIFRTSKSKIDQIKTDMQIEAKNSEEAAESGQGKIIRLKSKADGIKAQMDAMVAKKGLEARGDDEYVQLAANFQDVLAEANRITASTEQAKLFVEKYGSRAAIMKKLSQKLKLVEVGMNNKLLDFDATVVMLKKDYEFASKAKAATNAAKETLGFSKGWEFDYALDVITSTISADIAITSGNLSDINTLTSNYSLDSDELYANLSAVADKITVGSDMIPDANKYNNPEYRLTESDKIKSGGFGDLF